MSLFLVDALYHFDLVRQYLAAPIMTPGSKVSAFGIFPASVTIEQVTELMQHDPAIAAGRFTFEVVQALFPSLDAVKVEY